MSQLSPPPAKSSTLLSNKTYNVLKHIASIGLPAITTLYFALSQIWNLSHPGQVMATIAAVNAFLGAILGISTVQYNNSDAKYVGAIEVIDTGDKKTYSLNLNGGDPEIIDTMSEATFKVKPAPPIPVESPSPGNPPRLGGQ